jgi:mono/diheme cytochrome c family protein
MKRVLGVLFLVVLSLTVVVLFQIWHEPGSEQRETVVADRAAQIKQGEYLARAGNCMACHTVKGGAAYAGGEALPTPFGSLFAPNLTPDTSTGIGQWTSDDFWRAMHNGKSKDGRFLYPAFPYPNYTKVTRADSDALFHYLRSLPPVRQQNRDHALRFPYNQRYLLAFWRTLYFSPGEYVPQPAQAASWNRGAYLTQGLGHCSACHAPRNTLGASLSAEKLGGGTVGEQGWHATPLGGVRDVNALSELLMTGVSDGHAVAGPMADVVAGSLQHLTEGDVTAIAEYLVTLPDSTARPTRNSAATLSTATAVLRQGAALYETNCATCHGTQGEGVARVYPRLTGKASLGTDNAIRIVLDGGYSPSTIGNPRPYGMPPFSASLTDAEVAAVLSYVRTSWGNEHMIVVPHQVERLRGVR